jgi:ribosomal protein S18 acetylase RimI-like enzyme
MGVTSLFARFRKMGFEGPYYRGIPGKARFLFESIAWRTEIVFVATPESFAAVRPLKGADLRLDRITSFSGLEKFRRQLEAEYYDGFLDSWRRPFTWGEEVTIGIIGGQVGAFAWVQRGQRNGFPTYYGRLFERDARILRVGVVPSFRRQGLNSAMMQGLLAQLLEQGFERVFAESHKFNVPSVRTFVKVGFTPIGAITVLRLPRDRQFVRWSSSGIESHLREVGISLTGVGHHQA